jgi:ATP adenylyltransferase
MLDHEAALAHLPQRHARRERADGGHLALSELEQLAHVFGHTRPVAGETCMACAVTAGTEDLPGGRIHETADWIVEHSIGPLNLGTLIVKPRRHVEHVADLSDAEVAEMGPLLRRTAKVVTDLVGPDQVYVCLWSHRGGRPAHIHWVVQPVTRALMAEVNQFGPDLQSTLFAKGEQPDRDEVEAFAARARQFMASPIG